MAKADLGAPFAADPAGRTLGRVLLEPTRIYVKPLLALMERLTVKGMAHITGGGLTENVPRVLPKGLTADLSRSAWPRPAIFDWLQQAGGVDEAEMHRVFNCGIGMVVIVAEADVAATLAHLEASQLPAWDIGRIRVSAPGEAPTVVR